MTAKDTRSALSSPAMPLGLRPFKPEELVLSRAEAFALLAFFFPLEPPPSPDALRIDDAAFAQALLVAALDEERRVRAEEPDDLPPGVQRVAAAFGKVEKVVVAAARRCHPSWFRHADPFGGGPPAIGEAARARIAIPYRAEWLSHLRGAPLL